MGLADLYQFDLAPSVQRLLCGSAIDLPMALLSAAGEGWFMALVAGALAWRVNPSRREALWSAMRVGAILVATGMLVLVVKRFVHSPRPLLVLGPHRVRVLLEPLYGMSFPSGHSAAASAMATWAGGEPSAGRRWWPWALAALVGLSRVYVGAHWVTDVLGGWLIGIAVAALFERSWSRRRRPPAAVTEAGA